jgi:outer membrane protein OmpA-like peptidoglycan-associated protein
LPTDATKISQISSNTETGDSVYVKVIAGCDTCIEPIVFCNYTKYKKPKEDIVVTKPEEPGKNPYDDKLILPYLNKSSMDAIGFNVTPIQFNLNKADVRKDAISILDKNIEVLSKNPDLSVLIYGFADSRGKETYNLPLSKKRAQGVKSYLVSKKISKKQIEQVNGLGETFILNKCTEGVTCEDPEHEVNRRVEFILFENK